MIKYLFAFGLTMLLSLALQAQIEKVFIETYYVSDANDVTDTLGAGPKGLPIGSTTYRIYLDLKKGSKLISIYGNKEHLFKIESDSNFYNNIAGGQSFAFESSRSSYAENTFALDSWLTLGQMSKTATVTYFGVPKGSDRNGSVVGGMKNNDGGSAEIAKGLLLNQNNNAGIPITVNDGIDTMKTKISNWLDFGFRDFLTKDDSTIFGSLKPGKIFESNNCMLNCSGVSGVIPDSNQVLIAQLTTKGGIKSFELNVELLEPTDGQAMNQVKYVGVDNGNLGKNEKLSPYLKYPFTCGCLDPNYMEYNKELFACNDITQCKTLKVTGCMDPLACNFDPKATVSMPSMCCYPGFCNDRDISIVCPSLSDKIELYLFPNPAKALITLKIVGLKGEMVKYSVTNESGVEIFTKDLGANAHAFDEIIDVSQYVPGVYYCHVTIGETESTRSFVKQ